MKGFLMGKPGAMWLLLLLLLLQTRCSLSFPVVVSTHASQRIKQQQHGARTRRMPIMLSQLARYPRIQHALFMATSSSELKNNSSNPRRRQQREEGATTSDGESPLPSATSSASPTAKKRKKAPVAHRLSLAAKRASERRKKREAEQAQGGRGGVDANADLDSEQDEDGEAPLASLQQLTHAIDRKLQASQSSPDQWNRDSMTSVVRHNEQEIMSSPLSRRTAAAVDDEEGHSVVRRKSVDREVAIVLAKPLKQDHITVEYANRIRRLVREMMSEDYRPDVICFVGPQSPGNILADSDTGYMYFQYLTSAHEVSTDGIDIHLVKGSIEDGALQQIAFFLQETCLPAWLRVDRQNKKNILEASNTTTTTTTSTTVIASGKRDRLHVHFSLISSEYELCQLNDIHIRSPGQSVLRALESWSQRSFTTSWSYMYVTTVLPAKDADPAQAFCAKTYKTAQQLLPVVKNLRNVVNNREFFQTESYRVLVATRRSLVSDMESLYEHQPQLRAVHNLRASAGNTARPVDVALEGALLLLGRCLDIVRPAGLLTGSPVSQQDWKLALVVLKQAYDTIKTVCDPDQPLHPTEWMNLGDEGDEEYDYWNEEDDEGEEADVE
eukprot:CAMPEP_0172455300 /NCGR_PEP_ID=MMETSP1065-20121228/11997_1 /TAXON_ID=265537 /ORGANISM="Amphiprora paludosa, Strain CCMP125" /LENGTH=610 /DNA_ID=CAMNT_0013207761 /DNA_START=113 /DNA_END=1945 /DNA_ORIENTATION=-